MSGARRVTLELRPGQYAVVMSDELAGQYRVWSDPLQMMVEPSADPDVVELTLRRYECEVCDSFTG